jgi:hypothetical protein
VIKLAFVRRSRVRSKDMVDDKCITGTSSMDVNDCISC